MERVPLTLYLARRDRDSGDIQGAPTQLDIQAATEAWYQKGLAEGMAKAKEANQAAIARQEEDFRVRLAQERKLWSETEAAILAQQTAAAFDALTGEIGKAAARILQPLAEKHIIEDALAKLAAEIGKLFSDDDAIKLKVCGPPDLVSQLKKQIPAHVPVTVMSGDQPEVTVFANKTVIETRLTEWLARIGVESHAQKEEG